MGGITAKGNITKWDVKENDKKKLIDLRMDVMTSIGIYHLNISIGTSITTASLSGLYPGNLLFSGTFTGLDTSRVFEGRSF